MINIPNWNKILIAVVCVLGVLYAVPNFFDENLFEDLPDWMPGKQVNLGLDLQGGVHLLLHVKTPDAIDERLEGVRSDVRTALRKGNYLYQQLNVANGALRFKLKNPAQIDSARDAVQKQLPDNQTTDQFGTPIDVYAIENTPDGQFTITYTEDAKVALVKSLVEQVIAAIGIRINALGTTEPVIQQQGVDRILVQIPGATDPERAKKVIGQVAKMNFHLINQTTPVYTGGPVPPGYVPFPSKEEIGGDGKPVRYLVEKRPRVEGEHLEDAQPSFQDNQPVVSFRFDSLGGRKFGQTTRDSVGRLLAIVLDGQIISSPRINEPILGGSGIISGRFSVQEVNDLSLLLRAGALPASIEYLEERTVGPSLGQDSIDAGKIASIIGLVFVVVYMIVSYGLFGIMANVALFFNISLIIAILSGLQATLTLPGIAGIVLTIGMAVDANVLIFERIREEINNGRTPISAVDAGYSRALTTIVDANLTTLIAAVLLFAFGSGPIKGFAITLSIGILTSMFTAIMVTRLFVVTWLRRKRPTAIPI